MSLELISVTKNFGEKLLFRDFSYKFSDTGLYEISGESGRGKTTLLRLIAGLDLSYEGQIIGASQKDISVCFQEHRLFPTLDAVGNLTEVSFQNATEEDKLEAMNMLKRLGFGEADMKLYPKELSGGMRQRVAFARAILRKSKILLLDEPTKELDEAIKTTMMQIIAEQAEKRLVITVSHDSDLSTIGATVIEL